ncbi:MAG: nucleoside 2-deoxyribosyltransferase [Bacteroidales bacterium]|nr:nucleoside 2-deoxyribosyltransferase [Bacteroidales bacterium]
MSGEQRICLVGDILVDVTLKNIASPYKLRLGGIVHAARGLWALGVNYSVGYFAPEYLDHEINRYLTKHGCSEIIKLGNITGSPYVFLIEEVKEAGNQGYEFLLREALAIEYYSDSWDTLQKKNFSDLFFISGNYSLSDLFAKTFCESNLHLDIANNVENLSFFENFKAKFSTLFLSTSSSLFFNNFSGDFDSFSQQFKPFTHRLILKENRGGSRGVDFNTNERSFAWSQTQPIVHSVGVGDVYDSTFISLINQHNCQESMILSSWVASEYALTTYPDDFNKAIRRIQKSKIDELIQLKGVYLPWESRDKINIYIAAPDFDFMNRAHIEQMVKCLEYHNFKPRRPIIENGQMEADANIARRQDLFTKDIKLLGECQLLVAVLLNDDPGTLVEIGFASAKGMPTIVYDPYKHANNCMLTQLPTLLSSDLDEVISEVFIQSAKLFTHE